MSTQRTAFLNGEGDRYMSRNASALGVGDIPESVRLFARYVKPGGRVLEIGCANGIRLHQLQSLVPCEACGIDPSGAAIAAGKEIFPELSLSVGTADRPAFLDESFDLVIFGFCLYLVDRPLLTRTIAEADRLLRNRGFLGITDFDAKTPVKRPYSHCAGVWSYKLDYGSLFAAMPHFVPVQKISYSHTADGFTFDARERVASWVLAKDLDGAYPELP